MRCASTISANGSVRPHLAEMVAEQVVGRHYAYGDEFDFGLALVLDGLEQRFAEDAAARQR